MSRIAPTGLTVVILAALPSFAASNPSPAGSVDVIQAQANLERLRGLAQAGALAPARLAEAEEALGDAQDDQVLRATLYGNVTAQDLTEQQSAEMVAAAERRYDRQKTKLDRYEKLVAAGVLARNELEPLQIELASRDIAVDLARDRARLLEELAAAAQTESLLMHDESATQDHRLMERFDGDGTFSPADLKRIIAAYQAQFHKPLPISANGETTAHRALGFDHRGRVDVALNPDQPEGVWLRAYLEKQDIPYYAFRAALPGKATGPHIHLGPGSTRLRAAD